MAVVSDGRTALLNELLGRAGRLVVVSNRGPLTFEHDDESPYGLTARRGTGGLVTALAELGRHAPLTWIAAAMTDADREIAPFLAPGFPGGEAAHVRSLVDDVLPSQDLQLRYVDLPPDVFERHYRILSNPFLWFVQHQMYDPAYAPNVDEALMDAWRGGYRPANGLLADATILHFNHIPWPPAAQWQILPQGLRRAICEGLLDCDIVGFQTDRYAAYFLDTVANFVRDARVDRDGRNVVWRGRRIRVRSYPISVDPDGLLR